MNADDLYNVIIAVNIAIQKLLSFVVSKHAVEHPDARSSVANTAFSEVLSKHLPAFKEKVKLIKTEANSRKIFQANSQNLLSSIDISSLDSWFLLHTLLKVDEFFNLTSISGNCKHTQCQGQCCPKCNHASPVCKKCNSNSGNATRKCNHPCSSNNCKKSKEECDDYSKICCASCHLCKNCNKDALTMKENFNIINNISGPLAVYPCVLTEYQKSLQILLYFRNLFGHGSKSDYKLFLNGTQIIGDFKNIHIYEELKRYIIYAFEVVLSYTTDHKNFKKSPDLILDKVETLEDLECIFNCGKSLQTHLSDIEKFKEIFQVSADIIEIMQEFICDKLQGIMENLSKDDNKRNSVFGFEISICDTFQHPQLYQETETKVHGRIRKIIYNACTEALQAVGLERSRDYESNNIECFPVEINTDLQHSINSKPKIRFQMTLFKTKFPPEKFSDEMSDDVGKVVETLESAIKKGILEKYTEISFTNLSVNIVKWGKGSLIIGGLISLSKGHFTEVHAIGISDIIKTQATSIFKCEVVDFQQSTQLFDYSMVNFRWIISTSKPSAFVKGRVSIEEFVDKELHASLMKEFSNDIFKLSVKFVQRDGNEEQEKEVDEHHEMISKPIEKSIDDNKSLVAEKEISLTEGTEKEISLTEDVTHSSTNVASTSTSTAEPTAKKQRFDDSSKYTFDELHGLLKNKSTRDQFNAIIESNPSLTKLRGNINDTLLHRAAMYGANECVEVLIKNGSDVKEENKYGSMAIHLAAYYNHTQMMKILLSDPSLVNVTNNNNRTPLHGAAWRNHREAVELLLSEPSVDVNVRDDDGETPDELTNVNDQIKTMIRSHRNYSPRSTTDA